ncbi:hypothetical protein P152DRAFT_211739 [Eremomyces bilateralis CBS 781.70]|uniref:Zn(2)-C6 fungal-type domain-containing protein n=1 Tax=Eremomyces bilateralis CBS 781.70 TaxID=1392243 RepID=A0A6G1FSL8_9PEZI|nr:uncharacterized protein P152DRAFT_211739 [Eremomyces bilateralis CBS 781.70]KAF1808708.1 hypothetical protein P152DRAFT_211739 [Eremomyces bilateralis CBS 781.70]
MLKGVKREFPEDDAVLGAPSAPSHPPAKAAASPTAASSASSFRNVSACNRCRLRKHRCDLRLPACSACEKARVKCVGFDPITKREIPRSYVYYLETRVAYLEGLLRDNRVEFTPPEQFALSFKPGQKPSNESPNGQVTSSGAVPGKSEDANPDGQYDQEKLNKLVDNIGMVSVQGASDPRYLGSTSGISFARVVFAAVKSSVTGSSSDRGSVRAGRAMSSAAPVAAGTASMRDSFFGLHTRPTIKPAPFPDRDIATRLVEIYFEHANPQIPILHRGEFMAMLNTLYASEERDRSPRDLYMLNIVCAIGSGTILAHSSDSDTPPLPDQPTSMQPPHSPPSRKRRRISSQQHQPEEYHASAIVHLEAFLGSSPSTDRPEGIGGGLEELQAVLLLAGFALLRPIAPGLWYICGVAMRLGVDLGLHFEDPPGDEGADARVARDLDVSMRGTSSGMKGGRRQWLRDLRRRLWWCVYAFDRLVSTCVGRPFGITDQVVTTEFPSLLDDRYITPDGFLAPPGGSETPSYKRVSHHYFRLRLLQSEILQVLQYQQAQQARSSGVNQSNEFMHTKLPSPFLEGFYSFKSWRSDVDRRLLEWKESAPTQIDTGVQFSPLFLELNYWQALIMLYRQSLVVPAHLANDLASAPNDVHSPSIASVEDLEDEEHVYLTVAQAGQKVLKIYRQLHRVHLVSYTYLATHHLFMAGISFLYAIWHSTIVRQHLTLDDVDFTVLAATSVLGDLIEKCPPAEACRDAFDRMSKATIQMCLSTTGFGPPNNAKRPRPNFNPSSQTPLSEPSRTLSSPTSVIQTSPDTLPNRSLPKFDYDFRDLFTEDEISDRSFRRISQALSRPMNPPNPNIPPHQPGPTLTSSDSLVSHAPPTFPGTSPYELSPTQALAQHPHQPRSPYEMTLGQDGGPYQQQQVPYTGPFTTLPELEFIDAYPLSNEESNGMGPLDLGFGMGGFDANFNDGAGGNGQLDLFDGFFFGGNG